MANNGANAQAAANAALWEMFARKPAKSYKTVVQLNAQRTLFRVVSEGDIKFVKGLLTKRPDLVIDINHIYENGDDSETVLVKAAIKNYGEIAELLLTHGADPNIRCTIGIQHGFTPLMAAARHGNVQLVQQLVEHGADIHATTDKGKSVFQWALESITNNPAIGYLYERGLRAPPDFVPIKRIPQPDSNSVVFDTLMGSEAEFGETIGDTDNILFKYGDKITSFPREMIQRLLSDKEQLRYECTIETEGAPRKNQVKIDEPYFNLAGAIVYTIPFSQINYVMNIPTIRFVEIIDTGRVLPNVTGRGSILRASKHERSNGTGLNGQQVNLTSREHCNPGSKKTVYSLVELQFVDEGGVAEGGRRKRVRKTRRGKRAVRHTKKRNVIRKMKH